MIAHSRSRNPTHAKPDTPRDNYSEDWESQTFYYITVIGRVKDNCIRFGERKSANSITFICLFSITHVRKRTYLRSITFTLELKGPFTPRTIAIKITIKI